MLGRTGGALLAKLGDCRYVLMHAKTFLFLESYV